MTAALEGGEWSATRPGRTLPPGKTRYPILQEAGWAPGLIWTGGKSRPHRDSIPDRPARSHSLYRLSYRAHIKYKVKSRNSQYIGWILDFNFLLCHSTSRVTLKLCTTGLFIIILDWAMTPRICSVRVIWRVRQTDAWEGCRHHGYQLYKYCSALPLRSSGRLCDSDGKRKCWLQFSSRVPFSFHLSVLNMRWIKVSACTLYNLAFRTTAVGVQWMWRETEERSMLFNDVVSR